MNIAIASMFRDSCGYLDRYLNQVLGLKNALAAQGHTLRVIAAEADSTDETAERLMERIGDLDLTLVNRDNGSRWFGSVDHPERWTAIAYVCNGILEQVRLTDDILIYVESDLIWHAETMLQLVERVQEPPIDACAAMCFWRNTEIMYDIWGHRANGERFASQPPYHPMLETPSENGLYRMDSAGSCIVMKGIVARNARFVPAELGIVGFCGDLRGRGFSLWIDPQVSVRHP